MKTKTPAALTHEYNPNRPGVMRCGLEGPGLVFVSEGVPTCPACRSKRAPIKPHCAHQLTAKGPKCGPSCGWPVKGVR